MRCAAYVVFVDQSSPPRGGTCSSPEDFFVFAGLLQHVLSRAGNEGFNACCIQCEPGLKGGTTSGQSRKIFRMIRSEKSSARFAFTQEASSTGNRLDCGATG